MNVIAVTGGIGCGKSTVSARFCSYGIPCLDADALCHEMYQSGNPELISALRKQWKEKVFTKEGIPDRKALADIVFKNPEDLKILMNLVVLPLKNEILRRLKMYRKAGTEFVLLDVPLLFEEGWSGIADVTIAVWAPPEIRLQRVKARSGWDSAELERRRVMQMDETEKLERADIGIINSGTRKFLEQQCDMAMERIRERFAGSSGSKQLKNKKLTMK